MWYEYTVDIPASTEEKAPVEVVCKLTYGIVCQVVVEAAPGCNRLAGLRIFKEEHQVSPANPEEAFELDAIPRDFETRIDLREAPHVLKIRGYNNDDTYAHQYKVGFGILPPETLPEYRETENIISKLGKLLGLSK